MREKLKRASVSHLLGNFALAGRLGLLEEDVIPHLCRHVRRPGGACEPSKASIRTTVMCYCNIIKIIKTTTTTIIKKYDTHGRQPDLMPFGETDPSREPWCRRWLTV